MKHNPENQTVHELLPRGRIPKRIPKDELNIKFKVEKSIKFSSSSICFQTRPLSGVTVPAADCDVIVTSALAKCLPSPFCPVVPPSQTHQTRVARLKNLTFNLSKRDFHQPPPEEKIAKTDKKKEKELLLPFLITRKKPAFVLNQGALCSLHLGTMLLSNDSQCSLCDGRKRNIRKEKTFI